MLTTYELRWFYPGKVPEDMQHWFEQNCLVQPIQPPEAREDLYLYSPECEFLGIKLRQGQLEIKWRKAELGLVRFGEFIEGKVEKWTKWLCQDPMEESSQLQQILSHPAWVSIKKVRYSQHYQVSSQFSLQPVSSKENIDNGCSVELTHLVISDRHWWSLAFEAFGDDARLLDNLQFTANSIFNTYEGSKLLAVDSYAYPIWLALACR
ncbi:MAG: hypothetical protein N2235_12615 [Fischerella sp.]|nr:hypothetical protein [Fischerella sp.]